MENQLGTDLVDCNVFCVRRSAFVIEEKLSCLLISAVNRVHAKESQESKMAD